MKAIWNNEVIAESNETVVIEGNHYFPASSVNDDYLKASETTTVCPWKGTPIPDIRLDLPKRSANDPKRTLTYRIWRWGDSVRINSHSRQYHIKDRGNDQCCEADDPAAQHHQD